MIGDYLSSDLALDDFLRSRSVVKVRLEDPARFGLTVAEFQRRRYDEETERLRGLLHGAPQPQPHRMGRPPALDWTDPEVAEHIREMQEVGHSRAEMSRQLGVTRNALDRAVKQLRQHGRKSTTNPKESNI